MSLPPRVSVVIPTPDGIEFLPEYDPLRKGTWKAFLVPPSS